MSEAGQGYAAYKVADHVNEHSAWGLGVYSFFYNYIRTQNAIETPQKSGIHITDVITATFSKGSGGGIENVINNEGGATNEGDTRHYPGYNEQ